MGLNYNTHPRSNYLGRFDKENPEDMDEMKLIKKMVGYFNRDSSNVMGGTWGNRKYKWRVECKSRQVYKKHPSPKTGKLITYIPDHWGAVYGGMKNTRIYDAYIYRRYS